MMMVEEEPKTSNKKTKRISNQGEVEPVVSLVRASAKEQEQIAEAILNPRPRNERFLGAVEQRKELFGF